MAVVSAAVLKSYFETGDRPDQSQFIDLIDSLPNVANLTGVVSGGQGGTGIANTGKTITLGGNLAFSGAFDTTLTVTSATSLFLPQNGTVATTSGAETLTNKTIDAAQNTITGVVQSVATSGLATGGPITTTGTVNVSAATQTDMEAASSLTTAVTPGRVQYHPGVAKAFVSYVIAGGTPTVQSSYNVASLGDNGAGDTTINMTVGCSNTNYAVVTNGGVGSASALLLVKPESKSSGTAFNVTTQLPGTPFTRTDPVDFVSVAVFGDQ